jgi:hypothetical protein
VSKPSAKVVGLVLFMLGAVGAASAPAFAQSYTVSSASADVNTFIGSNFESVGALILEVAGAVLALVVLMWGIKWVLGLFTGRRTKLG